MRAPDRLTLQTRADDFSLQVWAVEDKKFWFRLERHEDRDVITDFFLGSSPEHGAARLLADCYEVLGITPKPVVVFANIVPANAPAEVDDAVTKARDFYTACGTALLAKPGAGAVVGRLVNDRGKYLVVLELIADRSATDGEDTQE